MSKTPISTVVSRQIPAYIRDEYGAFVDFIKAYYQFLEETHTEGAQPNYKDLEALHSIENTLDVFVVQFKKELSALFPTNQLADERFVLQRLREFFKTRGSEESYKFIFRAFFNEDVTITHPSENILKTSDGNWEQSDFITVEQTVELVANKTITQLSIINNYGNYVVDIIDIIDIGIDGLVKRFYYDSNIKLTLNKGDIVKAFDVNATGESLIYAGIIKLSPARLKIVLPGTDYSRGQVINIGTDSVTLNTKKTIARVLDTTSTGSVLTLEIIEHGYPHIENETFQRSPFTFVPASSITRTVTSSSPLTYNYIINAAEVTATGDNVVGITDSLSTGTGYGLESYSIAADFYSGATVIATSTESITTSSSTNIILPVEYLAWLDSLLVLTYEFDVIGKTKGRYTSDAGQISNQQMRIQDSYYYQLFSYLIETKQDRSNFKDILTTVHPAGLKLFSQILKEVDTQFAVQIVSTKSIDTKYIIDNIFSNDAFINGLTKNFTESPSTASESITSKLITKLRTDSLTPSEQITSKTMAKLLPDGVTVTDPKILNINKTLAAESITVTDPKILALTKTLPAESATASSSDTTTVAYLGYATDYFAENYSAIVTTLTIGQ